MDSALRVNATVLPGHRIELAAPDFEEGSLVEVHIRDASLSTKPLSDPSSSALSATTEHQFYPTELELEYQKLVSIQWQRALTFEESHRLGEVKGRMNELDQAVSPMPAWKAGMDRLELALEVLARKIDALPDHK